MLNEELLSRKNSNIFQYDPFLNPPDLEEAKAHRNAKKIGKIPLSINELEICPCCENVINHIPYDLSCEPEQLIQLGIGYPLFYQTYKYLLFLITLLLIISGGSFYFIITRNCVDHCYFFMGVPIINLQISAVQTVKRTKFMYVLTAFVLFFASVWVKNKIQRRTSYFQQKTINLSQYTILLQNLPEKIQQKQIQDWASTVFGIRPIKTLIVYDSQELMESINTRKNLTIALNKLNLAQKGINIDQQMLGRPSKEKVQRNKQIESQMLQTHKCISQEDKIIQKYKHSNGIYPWTGSCFVTFEKASTVKQILDKHEHSQFNFFVRGIKGMFVFDNLNFYGRNVVVCRAPQPRQVLWQNMQFSFARNISFEILFIFVMIGLMALAFKIQFAFVKYAFSFKKQGVESFALIYEAFIMAFIILVLNFVLRLVVQYLSAFNKPHSYTQQQSSFCNYYTLLFVINACFTIYIVHGVAIVGNNQLLLYDIHLVMVATALSGVLYKVFNPVMWFRVFWRYHLLTLKNSQNPYVQMYVNQMFESSQASNADNYQYMYRMIFVNAWFANIAPLGVLFSTVIMILDYWLSKYLLLRVHSQSKILSKQISAPLKYLEFVPLVYILGILPFILKVSTFYSLDTFVQQFYLYGFTFLILLVALIIYLAFYRKDQSFVPPVNFQQIQLAFLQNYETQNPLTKLSGEVKYLEKLIKCDKLNENQVYRVQQAINSKRETCNSNNQIICKKIVGLNRIKHKIQKKVIDSVNDGLKGTFGQQLKIFSSHKAFKDHDLLQDQILLNKRQLKQQFGSLQMIIIEKEKENENGNGQKINPGASKQ